MTAPWLSVIGMGEGASGFESFTRGQIVVFVDIGIVVRTIPSVLAARGAR